MNLSDPLSELQPLRVPATPDMWPPAPGWWLIAALALLAIGAALLFAIRHFRRNAYRRRALAELATVRVREDDNPQQLAASVNALLKRAALTAFRDSATARLTGHDWVEFLNSTLPEEAVFYQEYEALPYAPQADKQTTAAFCEAAAFWLRRHQTGGRA